MTTALIHDRGRGPEIEGTRITIDNLLPHFLDPDATEASIGRLYDLTPAQVAAARAYILSQSDVVLDRYLQIEGRLAPGNPPEVIEQAEKTRAALLSFTEWLARREAAEGGGAQHQRRGGNGPTGFPTIADVQGVARREGIAVGERVVTCGASLRT